MLYSKRPTSHHLHLFTSRCLTLLPAGLYPKDEQAVPGNLQSRKLFDACHPLTVSALPLTELPRPHPPLSSSVCVLLKTTTDALFQAPLPATSRSSCRDSTRCSPPWQRLADQCSIRKWTSRLTPSSRSGVTATDAWGTASSWQTGNSTHISKTFGGGELGDPWYIVCGPQITTPIFMWFGHTDTRMAVYEVI